MNKYNIKNELLKKLTKAIEEALKHYLNTYEERLIEALKEVRAIKFG